VKKRTGRFKARRLPVRLRSRRTRPTCEECGATLPPDSRFCNECGAEVRRRSRKVSIRDEYAQRVFTYGCLSTALAAVFIGLIVSTFSTPAGLIVMAIVLLGGVLFMRMLFDRPQ